MSVQRVNVFGAGVMGLCIATEVAARGHRVQIYDAASGPGPEACSWWSGGMLAPYCEAESAEEPVLRHGEQALNWWDSHTGCVQRRGTLVLALPRDRGELKRFARLTGRHQQLDRAQITTLEPAFENRFDQALFFQDEAHLDPRQALRQLSDQLALQGAQFHYGVDVNAGHGLQPADITIDATGLAARSQLSGLRGVKGEMLILRCPEIRLTRTIRLLHPRIPIYLVPRDDHTYMLGATMIESDERQRISARSLLELLGALYALHPAFAEAGILEIGVDARPAFANNMPRLRWRAGRLYANGLYRHGFLLAPAVAQMAAAVVDDPSHTPEFMYEN